MEYITVSAKTLDDAITEALVQLGVTSDQLDYEVIEKGSAGFLGIGMKQAVIKARRKETEPEEEIIEEIVEPEKKEIEKVLSHTSSGGACVNDVVAHVANSHLPFGGIGESGMGRYHGKESFYTFSHARAVLRNTTRLNPGIKFAPFAGKLPLIKRILR